MYLIEKIVQMSHHNSRKFMGGRFIMMHGGVMNVKAKKTRRIGEKKDKHQEMHT